jgi:hypothetical protein
MSKLNHSEHINLIQSELIYQTNEFKKLLKRQAAKMFVDHQLYLCRYQGFDEARGNIIVKFDHSICFPPRKNENLQCFVSGMQDDNVRNWGGLTYENLRTDVVTQFESKTVFFTYEKNHTLVGLSGAKNEDISKYEKNSIVFLAPPDPPLEYLFNLHNYLKETNPFNERLLSVDVVNPEWNPKALIVNNDIAIKLQTDLIEKDIIIIQGPPGTGKTYLMAQLCGALLRANFRILVTALTNRALIELAEKEHLRTALEKGLVYKSSLTADESRNKKIKGIKAFKSLSQQNPPMLLATYYIMSQIATKAIKDAHFDYIIIEEASQAFLSTIGLAMKLGQKCIVIGDIMQLEPIFHKDYALEDIHNYHWMIRGLKSISFYFRDAKQYILIDSYRLCQRSVDATNAFYNELLRSRSDIIYPLDFSESSILKNAFNVNGGTSIKFFNLPEGKIPSIECVQYIINLIKAIKAYNPKSEIAVLTFYRESVRFLQNEIYSKLSNVEDVNVETVDRIQGLTTDFCLFFISNESIPFSLDINRFNVATSRAKLCTLIISDKSISHFVEKIPEISDYFKYVTIVDNPK